MTSTLATVRLCSTRARGSNAGRDAARGRPSHLLGFVASSWNILLGTSRDARVQTAAPSAPRDVPRARPAPFLSDVPVPFPHPTQGMERLAAATVPRVAHRALATLPAARPPPAAVATHRDPSFCARGFAARGRFFAGRPRATHARWTATPEAFRRGDRRLVATPRAVVETETSDAETAAGDEAVAAPMRESSDASTDGRDAREKESAEGIVELKKSDETAAEADQTRAGDVSTNSNVLTEALDGLADVVATATKNLRETTNRLQAKTRAATHPPLPVVSTFDELLRFAKIASLNSAPTSEIEAFFSATGEEVVVLDMVSVKQRVFIATDHEKRRHTVSFRGTTNLTNVVQNIRLSNDPVTASGRLASVGRSLSGAFSGLTVSKTRRNAVSDELGDDEKGASKDPSSSSDSDSGSFDEDDAESCDNIDWSSATPESLARLGCTDHLPMHRGYRIIARECADALAPLMTPGYSVQLTGHSLGGAVAVATALLFRSRGASVEKVVTFGAPKLGPRETRDAAESLDVLRVVQKDDLIPLLPMSRPFVRKPYVHLGEGVVLDNDAPGRYARLTKEWGTAGILWKQRRHTGYARGESDSTTGDDLETEREKGKDDATRGGDARKKNLASRWSSSSNDSAFVSADEPDDGTLSVSDERERRGRFSAARERLRRLRAALGEGIARRRAAFAAEAAASADGESSGTSDRKKSEAPLATPEEAPGDERVFPGARAFAAEMAAWPGPSADAARASTSDVEDTDSTCFPEGWEKSAGGASSSRNKNVFSLFDGGRRGNGTPFPRRGAAREPVDEKERGRAERDRDRDPDPAPFDDVEGELFVRVAETTPDSFGASDVAAAAADEWERAAAATERGAREKFETKYSTTTPARSSVDASSDALARVEPPAAKTWLARDFSARDADHRAGPTIFEELWKLRGMDAETRGSKLESHRMRRYVEEIQRAIDAGPVQTSLAGVYAGKEGDEVGLDFSGDDSDGSDDATVEGGVASWMTWTR